MAQEESSPSSQLPSAKPSPGTATAPGCCRKPPSLPGNWIPFFSQVKLKILADKDSAKPPSAAPAPAPASLCRLGEHHLHPQRFPGRSLQHHRKPILFRSGFLPPQSPNHSYFPFQRSRYVTLEPDGSNASHAVPVDSGFSVCRYLAVPDTSSHTGCFLEGQRLFFVCICHKI